MRTCCCFTGVQCWSPDQASTFKGSIWCHAHRRGIGNISTFPSTPQPPTTATHIHSYTHSHPLWDRFRISEEILALCQRCCTLKRTRVLNFSEVLEPLKKSVTKGCDLAKHVGVTSDSQCQKIWQEVIWKKKNNHNNFQLNFQWKKQVNCNFVPKQKAYLWNSLNIERTLCSNQPHLQLHVWIRNNQRGNHEGANELTPGEWGSLAGWRTLCRRHATTLSVTLTCSLTDPTTLSDGGGIENIQHPLKVQL